MANVYIASGRSRLGREALADAEKLRQFIVDLVDAIGMTIVNGPTVHQFKQEGPDSGISGFAIIAESHIAVHTWPEEDWLNVCVVSCKGFHSVIADRLITERYKMLNLLSPINHGYAVGPPFMTVTTR